MIRSIIFLLPFLCSLSVSATEQIDDLFSIGRIDYSISELPLSQLYSSNQLFEIIHPQMCTASRRGYQANWRLRDDYLWLDSIRKNPCDPNHESIESTLLFKDKNYPIKADWFTGSISLLVGEFKYKYGKDVDDLIGHEVDVFEFVFSKGKLVSKRMRVDRKSYK